MAYPSTGFACGLAQVEDETWMCAGTKTADARHSGSLRKANPRPPS